MRNFKEELLTKTNLIVHCPKKEQAEKLLAWADSKGRKWCNGKSFLDKNFQEFHTYGSKQCYRLATGEHAPLRYYNNDPEIKVLSFEEALLPEYTYLEIATGDNIPDWWNGKPILVYYSDESEEEAISCAYKGWLLGITENCPDYPFIISDVEPDDEGFYKYNQVADYCTTNYKYVVPVTKTPLNVTGKLTITKDGKESSIELTMDQLKELGVC